jgi:hypothetical protein
MLAGQLIIGLGWSHELLARGRAQDPAEPGAAASTNRPRSRPPLRASLSSAAFGQPGGDVDPAWLLRRQRAAAGLAPTGAQKQSSGQGRGWTIMTAPAGCVRESPSSRSRGTGSLARVVLLVLCTSELAVTRSRRVHTHRHDRRPAGRGSGLCRSRRRSSCATSTSSETIASRPWRKRAQPASRCSGRQGLRQSGGDAAGCPY